MMISPREASHPPLAEKSTPASAATGASGSSASAGTRFAVVIVNYNGGPMLAECVDSVLCEGVPPDQIIVVDNGSRDSSIDDLLASTPAVRVLRNPCNAGFARAVNQGIQKAAAEFVLLLNNDAALDRGALQAFAAGFDQFSNMAIAGGQLHYPNGRLQSAFAPLPSLTEEIVPRALLKLFAPRRFARKSTSDKPMQVECVLGACLCVRASVLPRLGLLDEDFFFFFEEIAWCQRASRMGFEVFYLPAARCMHGHGQTADRFRGPARVEYQRSKLLYFRINRGAAAYWAVSAMMVVSTLINALAGALACVATLFLNRKLRLKTATYWYLLGWNLFFRPASWGLPDKCPPSA
jgi:hypothetical protein